MTSPHWWTLTSALCFCSCGTAKGTLFNVTATLDSTTCGSGLVDAEDSRSFQARLTKNGSHLTWYDVERGESNTGSVDDGVFSVATGDTYTLSEATLTSAGCRVRQHAKYAGELTLDEADDDEITEFEGTLVFEYTEVTGYDCDEYIGTDAGFADLPCEIEYTLVASPD